MTLPKYHWFEVLEDTIRYDDGTLEKAANLYAKLFFIDSFRSDRYLTLYKYDAHALISIRCRNIKFNDLHVSVLATIFSYLDISFFTLMFESRRLYGF